MSNPDYINFGNLEFLETLYETYTTNPSSIPTSFRYFFDGLQLAEKEVDFAASKDFRIFHLIEAYRTFGHLLAHVNPLQEKENISVKELTLQHLNFDEGELNDLFPTGGLLESQEAPLAEIIQALRDIYCRNIGVEFRFSGNPEMEVWLQKKIEKEKFKPNFSLEKKKNILEMLNKATLFEIFLHTKYVGQKRFSIEGGETLIPILNEIIEMGAELGINEFVIGMSHRGRLNVLTNILKKSYATVFSEFEDYYDPALTQGSGDVKYHKGFSANFITTKGFPVHLALPANPSHLESIDPVLEGKVYAKQKYRHDTKKTAIAPILIHGDASIAGQGVVYETLQLSRLEGYSTGGTIHIIVNNQIGFTTLPKDSRSTRYASDIAKTFSAPVFHVNAEDPEGCVLAASIALEIRQKFHSDVIIDLNCYRKYGHNEGDEPFFTQPLEYEKIRKKKTIREIYRDQLISENLIDQETVEVLEEKFKKSLNKELEDFQMKKRPSTDEAFTGVWEKYKQGSRLDLFKPVATQVKQEKLKQLADKFCLVPKNFNIHPKVQKLFEERKRVCDEEGNVDWALAEHLSLASLLDEGVPIRFAGQDSRRGTFSQRHAMWVDQKTGSQYFPLKHLHEKQGDFDIVDSLLSEYAGLGFEFGYSLSYPSALVVWEAQYGDFANGGQIVIDQFISSSEEKWQRYSGLIMLLPHGYEGQGPEHSSARLERYLQLGGNTNIQIVYPTTPAQYFHLLRRQVLRLIRKPLIVLTPKSLLRYPLCVSPFNELSTQSFQEIIDEKNYNATRLLICTGKVYYTLLEEREKRKITDIAIMRIEQLFPFHTELFSSFLKQYKKLREVFWVQEEPKNMGGWNYIFPILHELLPNDIRFDYIGRARRAAPATGSHTIHAKEEKQILNMAFS